MVGGGREVWELREGIAREGRGEFRVRARAKEERLERRSILTLDFCIGKLAVGI